MQFRKTIWSNCVRKYDNDIKVDLTEMKCEWMDLAR
jgi:hypothetical protein